MKKSQKSKQTQKPKRKNAGGRKAGPESKRVSSYIPVDVVKDAAEYTRLNKISRSKLVHDALRVYMASRPEPMTDEELDAWISREMPGFDYVISEHQFELIFAAIEEAFKMLELLSMRPGIKTKYTHIYEQKQRDVARIVSGFMNFTEDEALGYVRSRMEQYQARREESMQATREALRAEAAVKEIESTSAHASQPLLARFAGFLKR